MSTQYVTFAAAPARALTVELWDLALSLESADEVPFEVIANSGLYRVAFISSPAYSGEFRILVKDTLTGYGIATYQVVFEGTDGEQVQGAEFVNISGGDASEAKQDQIIAAISPLTTVYTPQLTEDTLTLVRGDAYDGVANNALTWSSSKVVTGYTVNFTIRDSQDVIVMDNTTTGVDTSGSTGNTLSVSLSSAATDLLDPLKSIYTFDVEVEFSATSRWTAVKGTLCVEQDVTRD
jgi:hypothetical protein